MLPLVFGAGLVLASASAPALLEWAQTGNLQNGRQPAVSAAAARLPGPLRVRGQTRGAAAGPNGRLAARSAPTRLRLPAITVDAPLTRLGLNPDGTLEVPARVDDVGWYEPGVAPGEVGAAVLAAHYDSTTGPAAFYRLGELKPGDRVELDRADGLTVRFAVDRVERHAKDRFPTQRVYGPRRRAELRLITCGGSFDRATGHYRDNVIVFAHLLPGGRTPPPAQARR